MKPFSLPVFQKSFRREEECTEARFPARRSVIFNEKRLSITRQNRTQKVHFGTFLHVKSVNILSFIYVSH